MEQGGLLPSSSPLSSGSNTSSGTLQLEPMWKVPVAFTPLIGREQEVADICTLLSRPEVRLVTLAGVGGIGKTRLSLAVAEQLAEYFTDGICFVHLAAVTDPELVVPTIAQELGVQESGARRIVEQVQVALRQKSFLLLLDNFEQVITAASYIEELLMACPALKIVVTSREVLHVRGEQEYPVAPLSLPDPLKASEDTLQSASVTLFVQRAQSILPTFQITPDNARTIAEICVRLDGLPLAIELAAARIKLLTPSALLARLSDHTQAMQVLAGGSRTFPERHQTLRNAIKWSYDLLDDEEQRFFRQLTVFAGGWTLEAAEALWLAGHEVGRANLNILDAVASLLDKSLLLRAEQEGDVEPRFMMLRTVRECGFDILQESGEAEAIQRAYALHYLKLAEEAERHLKEAQQIQWLARLDREQENLRVALGWLLERHEAELAWRFCAELWWFWSLRGYWSEGRRWLETALELAGPVEASEARAGVMCAAGYLAARQNDYKVAAPLLQGAAQLCRSAHLRQVLIDVLTATGVFHRLQGDFDAAYAALEEGERLCRDCGSTWQLAYVLRQRGLLAWHQGHMEQAMTSTQEALALARSLGDRYLLIMALLDVGAISMMQGDLAQATTLASEGLLPARELGDKSLLAITLQNLGYLASLQGDVEQAAGQTQEALSLFRELGERVAIAGALHSLGYLALQRHDLLQAGEYYREGLFLAREIGDEKLMSWLLAGLASVALAGHEPMRAARLLGASASKFDVSALMNAVEREAHEAVKQGVRAQLGETVYMIALAEGQAMSPEEILHAPEPETTRKETPVATPAPFAARPTYPAGLTAREVEILRLVAQGLTDAQVAETLVISPRTVNWHLTTIYSKLQVSSRAAATRFAIEQRLV